jgi:hypothetical protein
VSEKALALQTADHQQEPCVLQLNFWRDNGGIIYYVTETLGTGRDPEEFFLHDAPQAAFRHWVGGIRFALLSWWSINRQRRPEVRQCIHCRTLARVKCAKCQGHCSLHLAQVQTLANRRNTVNGRLYKEEPAILAFEVTKRNTLLVPCKQLL